MPAGDVFRQGVACTTELHHAVRQSASPVPFTPPHTRQHQWQATPAPGSSDGMGSPVPVCRCTPAAKQYGREQGRCWACPRVQRCSQAAVLSGTVSTVRTGDAGALMCRVHSHNLKLGCNISSQAATGMPSRHQGQVNKHIPAGHSCRSCPSEFTHVPNWANLRREAQDSSY